MQADESYELTAPKKLRCPESPAPSRNECPALIGHGVAFAALQRGWEKLHDIGIGVKCSKRLAVSLLPLPKLQTLCLRLNQHG